MLRLVVSMASLIVLSHPVLAAAGRYDIREFGAKPGQEALSTEAIQKAIDMAAEAGGGTVYLPPGVWMSGTLQLKDRITLELEAGAVLLGSPKLDDYPARRSAVRSYTDQYVCRSLIAGENLRQVAIRGQGVIDGNGSHFRWKEYLTRPYVIRLVCCQDVLVEGVRLQNSPMWMQHYLACDRLRLHGLTVSNHVSYNNDGVDIDGCRDVHVSDCTIDSDDDALCLKSTLDRACENVVVSNCILSSHCNAFKTGTESNGGFKNITLTNCAIRPSRESSVLYGDRAGLGGISLESVDGGHVDRIAISNIVIEGVRVPIFCRLGNRARPFADNAAKPNVGTFRNVMLSNIVVTGGSVIGCPLAGLPGHRLENVTLSNIRLRMAGGGTAADAARAVPELAEKYPEGKMFGTLPAAGFYCRHVTGLTLRDVALETDQPDLRPAVVCDDVERLTIDGLQATPAPKTVAVISLVGVRAALVQGCRLFGPAEAFLRLRDTDRAEVLQSHNHLPQATQPLVELR